MTPFKLLVGIVGSLVISTASADKDYAYLPSPIYFPPPFQHADPHYYQTVFTNLATCTSKKCDVLSKDYGADTKGSLDIVGGYTACVTSCIAAEVLNIVSYYKSVFAKLYDIGIAKLEIAKGYIAENNDFDVIGNRTRIEDSCCLPDDYFVDWDSILIPVTFKLNDQNGESVHSISVQNYLDYCLNEDSYENLFSYVSIQCNTNWSRYLQAIKKNSGHLILHPKWAPYVPSGQCNKKTNPTLHLKPNPQAAYPKQDMCQAYKIERVAEGDDYNNGYGYQDEPSATTEYVTSHFVKPVDETGHCDPYQQGDYVISYNKIPAQSCTFFAVTGLPNFVTSAAVAAVADAALLKDYGPSGECGLQGSLGPDTFNQNVVAPSESDVTCAQKYQTIRVDDNSQVTYDNGDYEYCNVKEFANYLTKQLFDYSQCPFIGHYQSAYARYESIETVGVEFNIACLYRIISLQCNCMQAVVNCYEHEIEFETILGKTLGQAASVLCGFILCQKENVYILFGEQSGVNHAQIFKEILLQVGAVHSNTAFPLASIAFLSFGLGMVAFVVTKQVVKTVGASRSAVRVEDGYSNLI